MKDFFSIEDLKTIRTLCDHVRFIAKEDLDRLDLARKTLTTCSLSWPDNSVSVNQYINETKDLLNKIHKVELTLIMLEEGKIPKE